jgi:hypothetical protein
MKGNLECEAPRPCLPAGRHSGRTGQAGRGFPARKLELFGIEIEGGD